MITVNGKKLNLKLDFGAVKTLKKEYGIDVFKMNDEDMYDIDVFTNFLYVTAKRGGSDITMEDIDSIDFKDIDDVMEALESAMEEFAPEQEKQTGKKGNGANGKPPLARKRQK